MIAMARKRIRNDRQLARKFKRATELDAFVVDQLENRLTEARSADAATDETSSQSRHTTPRKIEPPLDNDTQSVIGEG